MLLLIYLWRNTVVNEVISFLVFLLAIFVFYFKLLLSIELPIDMKRRFKDLFDLEVPGWIMAPFSSHKNAGSVLEELVELHNDIDLKATFKNSYEEFWLQKRIIKHYPYLWEVAKKILIEFQTSYLVERELSVVCRLVSKQRNRLDIERRGDLRLNLTNIYLRLRSEPED